MPGSVVMTPDLWSSITHRHILIVDVVVLLVFCVIHALVWLSLDTNKITDDDAAAGRLQSATTGGLTVAGILVPLTIVAITSQRDQTSIPNHVLVDFFVANLWFFCSIVAGLWVLFLGGYRRDLLRSRPINIAAGFQLIFLLVGGFRLIWGFGGLVQSFLQ